MIESHDLKGLLRDYFRHNSSRIVVLSPFITNSVLESILPYDSENNVTIVTSWRAEHLQSGVSNIELYQLAKERKWNLYINDNLHIKLYSNNYDNCYIGSANVTRKGLEDFTNSNIEGLYKIFHMNTRDNIQIERIILSSNLVTEELYQRYHEWFQNIEIQETNYELPPIILENKDDDFLITKLPAVWSPTRLWELKEGTVEPELEWKEDTAIVHDLALYKVNTNDKKERFFEKLTIDFFKHPFIESFCQEIDLEGVRFGAAKEWIQKNCTTVPTPYRRELTETVQCLFNWITELNNERFEIIQPNISQIIRLRTEEDFDGNHEYCEITARELARSWYVSENSFPDSGIQYKSCPSCSKANGKQLIFWIGRTYPDTIENREKSDFGFTPQRRNRNNPDGIQSQCNNCRKAKGNNKRYYVEKGHITIQMLEEKMPNFVLRTKGF